MAWFRKVGDALGLAWSLHHLGIATLTQGNQRQAAALLREALSLQQQQDHKTQILESLEGFAQLASAHGQATRAAQLLGARFDLLALLAQRLEALGDGVARLLRRFRALLRIARLRRANEAVDRRAIDHFAERNRDVRLERTARRDLVTAERAATGVLVARRR